MTFAETKPLLVQIELDRAGFSCNTIDGVWGQKSVRAFRRYAASRNLIISEAIAKNPTEIYRRFFLRMENPYRWTTVTQADLQALVKIPKLPAAKAQLHHMGYESLAELFAERGHLSLRALKRLNPHVNWSHVPVGTRIRLPAFPPMSEELSVWPKNRPSAPHRPEAALVRISLSKCEITVLDATGKILAVFPCSIAQKKAKLPPQGELKIITTIANPNYTYTSERDESKYVFPPGPNCPVGVAWLGLNLPGYGIHGTPRPETIGTAESHGCFRLSNWNAARLYGLVRPGTRVLIER